MKLIICEKPSQAKNMLSAVGSDRSIKVLPAQGHLFRLAEPGEVNPSWLNWTDDVLVPPSGFYPKQPDAGSGKPARLKLLRDALKDASEVVIACDCDREGQAIGDDIVQNSRFRGRVLRAMFTSEDPQSLRNAINSAKSNDTYRSLSEAAEARRQADQIYNLTLTRVVSRHLRPAGWKDRKPVGIGRVKTPTFGIVCAREVELRAFVAKPYFDVWMVIVAEGHEIRLTHVTTAETRIFDRQAAEALKDRAARWSGLVSCKMEPKAQAPDRPMDLPTLQKKASGWGWTAKKTLDTAQALYEKHKIATYPRAETRYLPEALIDDAPKLLALLSDLFPLASGWSPNIRKGKSGIFSDAGIGSASHHAIIPNVNLGDNFKTVYASLDADERRLFDLIARHYLAAIGPDHLFNQTTIALQVEAETFRTTGRTVTSPGWKTLFASETSRDDDNPDTADDEGETTLPKIPDRSTGKALSANISDKMTKPPSRYTEGSLIDAMQNAWRFLPEGEERERLKEAKGIGTPATRDQVIEGLKRQGWLVAKGKNIVPAEEALELYLLFKEKAPALVDPAFTARMEMRLDAVLDGKISAAEVVAQITRAATRLVEIIISVGNGAPDGSDRGPRMPSDKMIAFARRLSTELNVPLPDECTSDFAVCKAFIDQHGPKGEPSGNGTRAVSEKALAFAQKLAERTGKKIPESTLKDAVKLSKWIDANKNGGTTQQPNERARRK